MHYEDLTLRWVVLENGAGHFPEGLSPRRMRNRRQALPAQRSSRLAPPVVEKRVLALQIPAPQDSYDPKNATDYGHIPNRLVNYHQPDLDEW